MGIKIPKYKNDVMEWSKESHFIGPQTDEISSNSFGI